NQIFLENEGSFYAKRKCVCHRAIRKRKRIALLFSLAAINNFPQVAQMANTATPTFESLPAKRKTALLLGGGKEGKERLR
ncbi:hypothetical protein, partial [Streptococcus pyogenes]|uniref:hypothetical protein n=1 Tax=Streptococcus pyogenes TaxID=1314 RepID=UPI003DA0E606